MVVCLICRGIDLVQKARKFSQERRAFVTGLGGMAIAHSALANGHTRHLNVDGTAFSWAQDATHLHVQFHAPTPGWVAVGFNDQKTLKGTRFVIAAVVNGQFQWREHIALVPDHRRVEDLGLQPISEKISGGFSEGRTWIGFAMPIDWLNDNAILEGQVGETHLMLAWSHDTDFAHHSAWRRHFELEI